MAKPVNNMDYYDYKNISSYLNRLKISQKVDFRYLHDIVNTKISMYEYENLPETLTSEILETALCFNSNLCFYNSSIYGVCLCRYLPLGEYDIYWKPVNVQLLALNGKTIAESVPYEDIILVRDNKMDIIPFIYINEYINKMVEMEDTLIKNIQILKLPNVFTGSKQMVSSFNQLIQNAINYKPFAIADSDLTKGFTQFDISMPVKPEEILALFKNYKNMSLESIGIYGTETQKRERLLVGEIQSQTEYVNFIYQTSLDERRRFVEECNSRFGTNIKLIEVYKTIQEDTMKIDAERLELETEIQNDNKSEVDI